jgi:hypothetical protein
MHLPLYNYPVGYSAYIVGDRMISELPFVAFLFAEINVAGCENGINQTKEGLALRN